MAAKRKTKNKRGGGGNKERMLSLSEKLAEFCDLQKQEDDLMEKHIKPIREKKNAVKAAAKADHEIPTAAFNARASLRLIELGGDDEVVLATNEMFEAVPVGHTLDLFKMQERVDKKKKEEEAADALKAKAKAEKAAAKAKAGDSEEVTKGEKRVH